jgi:hypothetical protein
MLCATMLLLVGCKSEPSEPAPLCAPESKQLAPPWSEVQLPSSATICLGADSERHHHNYLGIEHRRTETEDVAQLRDRYVAAFRAGGWTKIVVADDAPIGFAADLSREDGSRTIAFSLMRRGEVIEVSAHRAGPGWPPRPGSWEEQMQRASEKQNAEIRESLERNVRKRPKPRKSSSAGSERRSSWSVPGY